MSSPSESFVNKSGVAALRGIARTGRLDDDGLSELSWYGAGVDTLTVSNILGSVLDGIEFASLSKEEQAAIEKIVVAQYDKDFQKKAVRHIVRQHR